MMMNGTRYEFVYDSLQYKIKNTNFTFVLSGNIELACTRTIVCMYVGPRYVQYVCMYEGVV